MCIVFRLMINLCTFELGGGGGGGESLTPPSWVNMWVKNTLGRRGLILPQFDDQQCNRLIDKLSSFK